MPPLGRNTPTGVGKTIEKENAGRAQGKHPHGCGEDDVQLAEIGVRGETPPRVWGRRYKNRGRECRVRNTPTGVGKTDPWKGRLAAA